jgi:hypothetical protein
MSLQGIYRLETLLEDAIDTQFDLFEIFVLRNTFSFNDDLLPYITLPHQVPFFYPSLFLSLTHSARADLHRPLPPRHGRTDTQGVRGRVEAV